MNYEDTPCRGCGERRVGCHATCKFYREWKANHDAKRSAMIARQRREQDYTDYRHDSYSRMTKRGVAQARERKEKGIRKDRGE